MILFIIAAFFSFLRYYAYTMAGIYSLISFILFTLGAYATYFRI